MTTYGYSEDRVLRGKQSVHVSRQNIAIHGSRKDPCPLFLHAWVIGPAWSSLRDNRIAWSFHFSQREPQTRWIAASAKKHDGSHGERNVPIWRPETRHFGSKKSCHGIPASTLHWEFRTVYFGLDPGGKEERVYSGCRWRWKIFHARRDSDYCKNGCG